MRHDVIRKKRALLVTGQASAEYRTMHRFIDLTPKNVDCNRYKFVAVLLAISLFQFLAGIAERHMTCDHKHRRNENRKGPVRHLKCSTSRRVRKPCRTRWIYDIPFSHYVQSGSQLIKFCFLT